VKRALLEAADGSASRGLATLLYYGLRRTGLCALRLA
jgi:hypothetical protein